jgi:hypothetical protein
VAAAHEETPANSVPQALDWRRLVAEQRPGDDGDATEHQRAQFARLTRTQQELQRWATRYVLPHEHLHQAAYFAIVSTPDTSPEAMVVALAQAIFWIYVFDDFLDQRLMSATPADSSDAASRASLLAAADDDIHLIVAPLTGCLWPRPEIERQRERMDRRHARTGEATLLDELRQATNIRRVLPVTRDGSDIPSALDRQHDLAVGLRDAFQTLLTLLGHLWRGFSTRQQALTYRQALVCRQFVRCMASMRREFRWNFQLAASLTSSAATGVASATDRSEGLPSMETYQMTGAVSIGMYAVAAVVASFEEHPQAAWQHCLAAIDCGGRIVRLANDISTYGREAEEGKLTAVTLALRQLGYPIRGLDPVRSTEVHAAQRVVSQQLHHEIQFFGTLNESIAAYPLLAFYLRYVCAFALAFYGDGSQYIANDA